MILLYDSTWKGSISCCLSTIANPVFEKMCSQIFEIGQFYNECECSCLGTCDCTHILKYVLLPLRCVFLNPYCNHYEYAKLATIRNKLLNMFQEKKCSEDSKPHKEVFQNISEKYFWKSILPHFIVEAFKTWIRPGLAVCPSIYPWQSI